MKCPKCQFENTKEEAKFCVKCGAKLGLICPECNCENETDNLFCYNCGHDLRKPQDTVPIDYEKPQSYTPKHLADKILTTRSSLEGERKVVTVLFADVANYTSMSEKLDPEEVLQIMDGVFKIMMDETHKYEGTINQFTGDGIMAIFGAPVAHENHAQRACYTALSIQNKMTDYSVKIERDYGTDVKIRIGINSGLVIVSAIGDDLRMDYTAVGDTTNLASRMEGLAEPGKIFLSENTHKIVERYFDFNPIGKTEVKGKVEHQDIYELLKASEVVTRIEESVAKGLTRFVGRRNSMAALMNAYDQVKSGLGQVVGVVGEAGVGKSRLILELKNRLPEKEFAYLEGQCLQYGGTILYMPILDIMRSLFDIKDDDREHIINKKVQEKILSKNRNLGHTLSPIQDLLSVTVEDETFLKLEPKQKRERIFEAIRDILIIISQEKPLIIVVEDLHWIDDTSEEFIGYFIEWMAKTPILLVLLYRTEYHHSWSSKTYYHKIGLDHLRKESSIELVTAMLKEGDVTQELRDLILKRAAGNPLFMEELTQTLIENGSIQKKANQYVLSRKMSDIKVPDTVQGIIAARMDRLEENLKRTMQVASVIGRDFAFRILHTITGMHEELKSYLRNLQGLEFIYEKRLFPELEYIFKHALTQEVAYNSLLVKRRKHIHENIGKAIEELYADRLEEFYEMLAYHYSMSDNLGKSYLYLKLAGRKAWSKFAIEESYKFFSEAFYTLKKMPITVENNRELIAITLDIYNPMMLLGFPEGSLEILSTGEVLSKEINDELSLNNIYVYISIYYLIKGDPLKVNEYVTDRFNYALSMKNIDAIAPLGAALCSSYGQMGDYQKVLDISSEIITLLEKTNNKKKEFPHPFNLYSWFCSFCGMSLANKGRFQEGQNYFEKALNLAGEINHLATLALAEFFCAWLHILKGEGENAIEHLLNSIDLSEKANPFFLAECWSSMGHAHFLIGDLQKALEYAEKGISMRFKDESRLVNTRHYLTLCYIHHDLGNISEAKSFAKKAMESSKKLNEFQNEGISEIWFGRVLYKNDKSNNEKSEEYLIRGIKKLKELKDKTFILWGDFFLGELYANTGRKDKALENLNSALSMCQEMRIEYWPEKIQQVLDRL